MRRAFTVPNVLSTIAVLMALAGSGAVVAYGAIPMFNGTRVVNESLTSADVKDKSLQYTSFNQTTLTQLKAKVGPTGPKGPTGNTGGAGLKGFKGVRGIDAARAYSYITADDTTSFLTPKSTNKVNYPVPDPCGEAPSTLLSISFASNCTPYAPFYPHWAYDCDAVIEKYCGMGDLVGQAGAGATALHTNSDGVVGFTGDANGSFVSLMGPGNILINASLTLMHPDDGFHSRVSCQPQVRKSNTSDVYTDLGVPTVVSAKDAYEIVHISVAGAAHFSDPNGGDYDFQVACHLLDEYNDNLSVDDWFFIAGNAIATTTEM